MPYTYTSVVTPTPSKDGANHAGEHTGVQLRVDKLAYISHVVIGEIGWDISLSTRGERPSKGFAEGNRNQVILYTQRKGRQAS